MRLFLIFLLLTGCSCFSQPLTVTIVSITSSDSVPEHRKFELKYLIKNNTSDTLKMFFKSNGFKSNGYNSNGYKSSIKNSISNISYYKIYENNTFVDIGPIFMTEAQMISGFSLKEADSIKAKEEVEKMYIEYLSERYKTAFDSLNMIYQKEGFESLLKFEGRKFYELEKKRKLECQILNPNEQLEFFFEFNWDKRRYYFRDPNEYYLAENAKHYMEITLIALKEELQDKIDETIYKRLIKDPNFIKGVFISNKVEINLKPD